MDVDLDALVEVFFQAQHLGARADVGHGGLGGLFHDVAKLSGQDQATVSALHLGDLDGDDVTADFGVDQARRRAHFVEFFHDAIVVLALAQELAQLGVANGHRFDVALGDAAGDFAAERSNRALEVADTGLAGMFADDAPGRLLGDDEQFFGQAVFFDLLGDQELLGDLELFFFSIARERNDL